ncbi:MAG: MFS transporter [Deltaproteobacteria bacterium]|nr:MFS transporter [Deltaproteobacteria bacterium]
MTAATQTDKSPTVFGHPAGLFTLFFAEMWERFSYYGMRALLVFYMLKGFLGYNDTQAYGVYGAYTALVYATPFIGGMLADRLLGARRAVVIGGILMAAGHLLMTAENSTAFFTALALLIAGNGFFKPNISTIVGSLYPPGSPKRDSGFTIFYMGINLGAAMSPLVCGYIGEVYGWHYGFGLATIGMLIGVAIFVAPTRLAQAMILIGAVGTAAELLIFNKTSYQLYVQVFVALALVIAAVVATVALNRGGIPEGAGDPKDPSRLKARLIGPISNQMAVYLGVVVAIPVLVLLVQRNTLAGYALSILGLVAFVSIFVAAVRSPKIERERMFVILILLFFNMLFWAFFEQAGSSVNNFTDRNIDRVAESRVLQATDVGKPVEFDVSQEQLGYSIPIPSEQVAKRVVEIYAQKAETARAAAKKAEADGEEKDAVASLERGLKEEATKLGQMTVESLRDGQRVMTIDLLDALRTIENEGRLAVASGKETHGAFDEATKVSMVPTAAHVGMGIGKAELPASLFQAANPIYIIIFGLVFSALWAFLGARGFEPSTPVKFSLGLLQLGLGFGALWMAARGADARGMTTVGWLLLGYLLQTTGELCLSPVGLSMVTKLSPERMVSTVMGAWFLATAFSNYLAAIIASFTGVGHGSGGAAGLSIPIPLETVHVYGEVFGKIGIAGLVSAGLLFMLSPLLRKWMHGIN